MRCEKCGNKLLQKTGNMTRLRVTGIIDIDDDGNAHTQCYWCKAKIKIPLELKSKAEESERFTILGDS